MINDRYRAERWCPVCHGYGGWDKDSYKPRYITKDDTTHSYMTCVWCGGGYVIRKIS